MIYIDDVKIQYKRTALCHLFCDGDTNPEELHAFARALNMSRAWFKQGLYYNMSYDRRAAAVAMGAQPVTHREAIAMWKEKEKRNG